MLSVLLARSEPILRFKREQLSVLHKKPPVLKMGDVPYAPLASIVRASNVMVNYPSTIPAFSSVSEFKLQSDVEAGGNKIIGLLSPHLKKIVSTTLGCDVNIFRAVIDTMENDSFILPHVDTAIYHYLCLRLHVPLIVNDGAMFAFWHPETFEMQRFKILGEGGIYAFNNFEPHAVTMLGSGLRSHLVVDVSVANLLDGVQDESMASAIKFLRNLEPNQKPTDIFPLRMLTHDQGSTTIRNILGAKYMGWEETTIQEQQSEDYKARSRDYLYKLMYNPDPVPVF